MTSDFGRRVKTTVRAALSHHNDEGGRDAFPVAARHHPQAAYCDPLNTLAGPGGPSQGARVKPEVAAPLLA